MMGEIEQEDDDAAFTIGPIEIWIRSMISTRVRAAGVRAEFVMFARQQDEKIAALEREANEWRIEAETNGREIECHLRDLAAARRVLGKVHLAHDERCAACNDVYLYRAALALTSAEASDAG